MGKGKQEYNIFQGRNGIKEVFAQTLGYSLPQEYAWFTENIYFQAYFYLSKRFGSPMIMDEYKDGGTWDFQVKQYTIRLTLNSSWLEVMIFGKGRKNKMGRKDLNSYWWRDPYLVRLKRQQKKLKNKLIFIPMSSSDKKGTARQKQVSNKIFSRFCKEQGVDETWTQEQWEKEGMPMKWYHYAEAYNKSVLKVDAAEMIEKYGETYSNSQTRHALRTLRQFLQNMLTPIWVRDVSFNIKGHCDNNSPYTNNIKITCINNIR